MNETEERVRQTLQLFGARSPEVAGLAEGARTRARSNRRKKLATASGVLVAAVSVGAVWILSPDGTTTPIATSTPAPAQSTDAVFPLPTSDWEQGDSAEQALLNGALYRDGQCLLSGYGPDPAALGPTAVTAVVWPQGFTASDSDKGVVSVRNAAGKVVALSGQAIKVGGGYSATDGDVTSDVISSLEPQCAGKYDDVFVVQDNMTDPQGMPTDDPSDWAYGPEGAVTTPERLEGKWFAAELYGKDVKPRTEETVPVPYLVFAKDPTKPSEKSLTWSTKDGCTATEGQYIVYPEGTFNASDGSSISVDYCDPVWSMHGANMQAVTEADHAVLLPADDDGTDAPARLLLLFRGETIGVYTTS